jgi:hypothetical protein
MNKYSYSVGRTKRTLYIRPMRVRTVPRLGTFEINLINLCMERGCIITLDQNTGGGFVVYLRFRRVGQRGHDDLWLIQELVPGRLRSQEKDGQEIWWLTYHGVVARYLILEVLKRGSLVRYKAQADIIQAFEEKLNGRGHRVTPEQLQQRHEWSRVLKKMNRKDWEKEVFLGAE